MAWKQDIFLILAHHAFFSFTLWYCSNVWQPMVNVMMQCNAIQSEWYPNEPYHALLYVCAELFYSKQHLNQGLYLKLT